VFTASQLPAAEEQSMPGLVAVGSVAVLDGEPPGVVAPVSVKV